LLEDLEGEEILAPFEDVDGGGTVRSSIEKR